MTNLLFGDIPFDIPLIISTKYDELFSNFTK